MKKHLHSGVEKPSVAVRGGALLGNYEGTIFLGALFAAGAMTLATIMALKYGVDDGALYNTSSEDSSSEGEFISSDYEHDKDGNYGYCNGSADGRHWIKNAGVEILTIGTIKVSTLYAECYFCGPVWYVS